MKKVILFLVIGCVGLMADAGVDKSAAKVDLIDISNGENVYFKKVVDPSSLNGILKKMEARIGELEEDISYHENMINELTSDLAYSEKRVDELEGKLYSGGMI